MNNEIVSKLQIVFAFNIMYKLRIPLYNVCHMQYTVTCKKNYTIIAYYRQSPMEFGAMFSILFYVDFNLNWINAI